MTGSDSCAPPTDAGSTKSSAGDYSGYVDAFYDVAKLLGIAARAKSPADVWRDEMLPALQRALATPPSPDASPKGARDQKADRIAEMIDEGGAWCACSGCQESEDGHVSARDYPYSAVYRCQPGGGCTECGGIGVIWEPPGFWDGYGENAPSPDASPDSGEALARAKERQAARDACGDVHVDGSIYEGMEASLQRGGRTIAHVARYADAVEIAAAMNPSSSPAIVKGTAEVVAVVEARFPDWRATPAMRGFAKACVSAALSASNAAQVSK